MGDQVYPVDQVNAESGTPEDTLEDLSPTSLVICRFHADLDVVHEIGKHGSRNAGAIRPPRPVREWQFDADTRRADTERRRGD